MPRTPKSCHSDQGLGPSGQRNSKTVTAWGDVPREGKVAWRHHAQTMGTWPTLKANGMAPNLAGSRAAWGVVVRGTCRMHRQSRSGNAAHSTLDRQGCDAGAHAD